jgi:hypothetical protein
MALDAAADLGRRLGARCRDTRAGFTGLADRRYRQCVTENSPDARDSSATLLEAMGIVVTDEGKARARAKLAEADARWTPKRRAEARRQLGLPRRAA